MSMRDDVLRKSSADLSSDSDGYMSACVSRNGNEADDDSRSSQEE